MRQPLSNEELRYAEADRLHLPANWAIRAGWRLIVGNRKILILCLAPKSGNVAAAAEGSWESGGVPVQGCGLPN